MTRFFRISGSFSGFRPCFPGIRPQKPCWSKIPASYRLDGRVVMQGTANPRTSVQFRLEPPSIFYNLPAAPCRVLCAGPNGEIGRRMGLKIPRPQGHPGSSPGSGTTLFLLRKSALFRCQIALAGWPKGLKVPCVYKTLNSFNGL